MAFNRQIGVWRHATSVSCRTDATVRTRYFTLSAIIGIDRMKPNFANRNAALFLSCGFLFACSAVAAPNERAERNGNEASERRESAAPQGHSFDARQRSVVNAYFAQEYRAGRCPPGLAKKNNGCNPPGQVRQWERGQPLPADVHWHALARDLQTQLGRAPTGYRYASVDNDVLLLELGTQVVVDVVQALQQQ